MCPAPAGVMELVDVVDSKSTAGDSVPVRVRSPAPARRKLCIACDEFFCFQKTHRALTPLLLASKSNPLTLGFDFGKTGASGSVCLFVNAAQAGAHSFRCSSFSSRKRFAGLRLDGMRALEWCIFFANTRRSAASFVSLATSFLFAKNSSCAHAAAPRFQIEPAYAGLRFGENGRF